MFDNKKFISNSHIALVVDLTASVGGMTLAIARRLRMTTPIISIDINKKNNNQHCNNNNDKPQTTTTINIIHNNNNDNVSEIGTEQIKCTSSSTSCVCCWVC